MTAPSSNGAALHGGNGITDGVSNGSHGAGFKYAAFKIRGSHTPRIGSLDLETGNVTPLTYRSGTPIHTLYEVIQSSRDDIIPSDESVPADQIELLPPIYGKDVLAVGKNYSVSLHPPQFRSTDRDLLLQEHAKEFNASGYDSSDKVDQPTHPVIFTKRATSIVPHGADILPNKDFTQTLDYEGEIGVIIGKLAFQVSEADAPQYVWGYTIINDVTAREKQRDHKQFFLGKSADTFCPIGPVAVAKEDLPETLEVVTRVNGEQRQKGTTNDLIFSVPHLISVISSGQTLLPGDVIATGTPAGVGFGFKPPIWLQSGDEIEISVTGLGTLKNRVGKREAKTTANHHIISLPTDAIPTLNNTRAPTDGLVSLSNNAKSLFYKTTGPATGKPTLCIHGLGGTHDYYTVLAERLSSRGRSLHVFDLEGHGLSPVPANQTLSISSFAADAYAIATDLMGATSGLTVIGHSMGCLAAMELAASHPELVDELVLMGPPPSPLPSAAATATYARAATVRAQGMNGVAEAVARAGTSGWTQAHNALAFTAARLSLLGQEPEGYAKACHALADSSQVTIEVGPIRARTLLLTGSEDKVGPPALCEKYKGAMQAARGVEVVVVQDVAHWHLFEKMEEVVDAVDKFLA